MRRASTYNRPGSGRPVPAVSSPASALLASHPHAAPSRRISGKPLYILTRHPAPRAGSATLESQRLRRIKSGGSTVRGTKLTHTGPKRGEHTPISPFRPDPAAFWADPPALAATPRPVDLACPAAAPSRLLSPRALDSFACHFPISDPQSPTLSPQTAPPLPTIPPLQLLACGKFWPPPPAPRCPPAASPSRHGARPPGDRSQGHAAASATRESPVPPAPPHTEKPHIPAPERGGRPSPTHHRLTPAPTPPPPPPPRPTPPRPPQPGNTRGAGPTPAPRPVHHSRKTR